MRRWAELPEAYSSLFVCVCVSLSVNGTLYCTCLKTNLPTADCLVACKFDLY